MKKVVYKDHTDVNEKAVHKSTVTKETIFQHLIRVPEFKDVPVGVLKRQSEVLGALLLNTYHDMDTYEGKVHLLLTVESCDKDIMRNVALNGLIR